MTVRTKLLVWALAGLFVPTGLGVAAWFALSRSLYQQEEARARRQADHIEDLLSGMQAELLDAAGDHRPAAGQDQLGPSLEAYELGLLLDGEGRVLDPSSAGAQWTNGEWPFVANAVGPNDIDQWVGCYKRSGVVWVLAAVRSRAAGADDRGARWLVLGRPLLAWLNEHQMQSQVYVATVDADKGILSLGPRQLGVESLKALPQGQGVRTVDYMKLVRFLPLRDPSGRVLAHLAVVTERSWAQQMNLIGTLVGASVFLVAMALAAMLLVGIHAYVLGPLHELQRCVAEVRRRPANVDTLYRLNAPQEIRQLAAAIARFVEDRQNSERALVESQAVKSQFLANTSHELRTPLNAIVGFTQLILDDLYADQNELLDFVSRTHRSALHLLGLVNDVLDLSKVEAGRFVLQLEIIGVDEVLAGVEQLFAAEVEQKNVRLVFDRPAESIEVMADLQRLRQVFFNVVGNAVKFTDQGSITISCQQGPRPGRCTFTVRDTGIGLPPDQCDHVFQPFVQGNGRCAGQREGSGLGLTICRELLAAMGGKIWLRSDGVGAGCRVSFTVLMPGAADPLDPDSAMIDALSAGKKIR
jgi:signal transduction histidine kinase